MSENNENNAKRLEGAAMGSDHFSTFTDPVDSEGKIWLKLIGYCKKYLPAIVVALVFSVVGSVLEVIGPDKLRVLTDEIKNGLTGSINMSSVAGLTLTLALLFAGSGLLTYIENFIMAIITARISKNMRSDISGKINRLPLKYFDRVSLGDVTSRVTNDVDTIGQTLNQNIGLLVTSVTLFAGALIMMFWSNWILALTAIAASAIGFVLSKVLMSRSKKYFKAQQSGLGAINGHIDEVFSGHTIVKAYNGGEAAEETFTKINTGLYGAVWKAQFVSGLITPLMSFSGNIAYVAICVVGAILTMRGQISFGVIIAFILYAGQFTQALTHIAETIPGLQSAAAASERVFELLDEEELSDESHITKELSDVTGNVTFEHINFGYVEDKTVIHDFSAEVKSGQKIAIVGPTGAGKTTIVNLVMRFYEPDGGRILIDGIPTSEVPRDNVHAQFGMVLQDTWLFEGSIRENIIYNKSGVTDDQVTEICKAVGLHHHITTLPDGYDTVLDNKVNLSEGQKQLVTIARAMLQNAPMLIMDEATSSVDTRTEVLIQEAMDKLMTGRTSFIIAHRLSTIKNADMILVLKDGDIIEKGTHYELLKQNGFYTELYNSQFKLSA